MRRRCLFAAAAFCMLASATLAADGSAEPKPVPRTRPEMKEALEALKHRQPRLPLPPLTAEERARYGDRPVVSNGRARALYLPREWYAADFKSDPAMALDNTFKVRLFWIVSRGNNCQYCLGHQEVKLSMAGMTEDEIAALDGDWSRFPEAERAAMRFTRKLTLEPHRITASDLDELRPYYNDAELIELVYTVSFFNSVNRWTDSLGLPQDRAFRDHEISFRIPTPERYLDFVTTVVPATEQPRPSLESPSEVEVKLDACRTRTPRAALLSEQDARKVVPDWPASPVPQWTRALAQFPSTGATQIAALQAIESEGRITPLLKAQLAWTAARQNRAWYALGHARQRLHALGMDDDAMFALDGEGEALTPAEREALRFARKLTAAPRSIADADIARLRRHYPDHEVAEIVYVVCAANMFDRFTETLGLALED